MKNILEIIKPHGRLLAIVPFLTAITITFPKLYLEVIGTDGFGTREILRAVQSKIFHQDNDLRSNPPVRRCLLTHGLQNANIQ